MFPGPTSCGAELDLASELTSPAYQIGPTCSYYGALRRIPSDNVLGVPLESMPRRVGHRQSGAVARARQSRPQVPPPSTRSHNRTRRGRIDRSRSSAAGWQRDQRARRRPPQSWHLRRIDRPAQPRSNCSHLRRPAADGGSLIRALRRTSVTPLARTPRRCSIRIRVVSATIIEELQAVSVRACTLYAGSRDSARRIRLSSCHCERGDTNRCRRHCNTDVQRVFVARANRSSPAELCAQIDYSSVVLITTSLSTNHCRASSRRQWMPGSEMREPFNHRGFVEFVELAHLARIDTRYCAWRPTTATNIRCRSMMMHSSVGVCRSADMMGKFGEPMSYASVGAALVPRSIDRPPRARIRHSRSLASMYRGSSSRARHTVASDSRDHPSGTRNRHHG